MSGLMRPPESGVRVRMYRPAAIGDSFLCAFRGDDGSGRYLLVDCGSLADTEKRQRRMREIVDDIEEACGGHLHLLVVTHEHWDHLSGFHYGKKCFGRMKVDQVWLPWTADPGDAVAIRLRAGRTALLRVLRAAARELRQSDAEIGDAVARVLELWGFGAAPGTPPTERPLDLVRKLGKELPRYLDSRAAPIELPQLASVRFHVLGPCRDLRILNRANAFDDNASVVGSPLNQENAGLAAALDLDAQGSKMTRRQQRRKGSAPFDSAYRVPIKKGQTHAELGEFYTRFYGFSSRSKKAPAWRRLGGDFLVASTELASRLDADVDNASLALAVELPGGQVLLFAGDAQLEAWNEWHTLRSTDRTPVADLLRRTVLYKLSHHGSRNGTPWEQGLELMTHDDLVAMAPVDARQAKKRSWRMPFGPTLEAVSRQTRGRILRADEGRPRGNAGGASKKQQTAREKFLGRTRASRLWVEITI